MNRLAVALLIGACALVPRLGAAQEAGGSPETSAVEMADTKAEHEALAAQYQQKAADARAERGGGHEGPSGRGGGSGHRRSPA